MILKTLLLFILVALTACSEVKHKYQDTSNLEAPPRLVIIERPSETEQEEIEENSSEEIALDDVENPPILKIKKLYDRSWDLVGQALDNEKIEITDRNRDKGIYFVKFDPSGDSGTIFGGIKVILFETGYQEAEYEITVDRQDTATEVRSKMITKQDFSFDDEDDEELIDASDKLIQVLYEAINEVLVE